MPYGQISNDWFRAAPRQTATATSGAGSYYGFAIPSKLRRLGSGFIVYAPSLIAMVRLQSLAHAHGYNTMGSIGLWATRISLIAIVYGWALLILPQHEGQDHRKWFKTQVVQFREANGAMVPYWPTTPRLLLRAFLVLLIDAPFGWLSVAMSKGNRSFGDRICGTVVIMAGQVEPLPPNPAKPRRSWIEDATYFHYWRVLSGAESGRNGALR